MDQTWLLDGSNVNRPIQINKYDAIQMGFFPFFGKAGNNKIVDESVRLMASYVAYGLYSKE